VHLKKLLPMNVYTSNNKDYLITTDKSFLDINFIHQYLSQESYWAKGISMDVVKCAIENSLTYGVYHGQRQVGYAKVVTDFASVAYIGDVFITPSHRGKGLSVWLMETIIAHPQMQNLRRWVLATKDAHKLYEKTGFKPLAKPERWMERHREDAYLH